MERRRCIWATSQPWRSTFRVSSHHLARCLVDEGWDVVFLSHPVSPLHLVHSRAPGVTRDRLRNWRAGGAEDLGGHLYHYTPLTLCPPHGAPLLRRRGVLDLWPRVTMPNVGKRIAARGFRRVDLLVIDSERYGFLLDAIDAGTTVLRLVDAIGGFDGTAPAWIERCRDLIPRVDHVVVTAHGLEAEARAAGARSVTCVPNGVETAHFAAGGAPAPRAYRDVPAPRAVYAGALESWFDDDLLVEVASALPHVSFVLIGPPGEPMHALRAMPNVVMLGARDYDSLPPYLAHAAVGIIPFRVNALTRCVNPIKLYEYMACGLPVVATAWEELERLGSPAVLCRTPAEFAEAIAAATERPVDRRPILEFARRSDWRVRAHCLLDGIGCRS